MTFSIIFERLFVLAFSGKTSAFLILKLIQNKKYCNSKVGEMQISSEVLKSNFDYYQLVAHKELF